MTRRFHKEVAFLACWTIAVNVIAIANPGYFLRDEFDFRDLALTPGFSSYFSFAMARSTLVFRPVGMALIGAVAGHFQQPVLVHLWVVFWHMLAALSLYGLVRRFDRPAAPLAAALFSVCSLTSFAVSWVAAIFDITFLLFSCLGLTMFAAYWRGGGGWRLVPGVLFVLAALLSKDTAIVMPGAVLLVGLADHDPRKRANRAVIAAALSALLVALYLVVRMPVLAASASAGGDYRLALDGTALVRHLIAYWAFPFLPRISEIHHVALAPAGWVAAAMAIHLVIAAAAFRRDGAGRIALYGALYFLPLLPVLFIQKMESQYLYASGAAFSVLLALCFRRYGVTLPAKAALGAVVALVACHSLLIQMSFYRDGQCQVRLYDSARDLAAGDRDSIGIATASDAPRWVLLRSLREKGLEFADGWRAVHLAPEGGETEAGGLSMSRDCRLERIAAR